MTEMKWRSSPQSVEAGTPTAPLLNRRIDSVDGLRAVAVTLVVAYHLVPGSVPGGMIGVDLFFVISGFVIGRSLLTELQTTHRISMVGFMHRRFSRLMPPLVAAVALTMLAVIVWAPETLTTFRRDVVASLTYTANWWFILSDRPYAEAFSAPPVLQHMWSIAVEEQFYLVAPILVLFVADRTRGGAIRSRRLALVAAGSAGASMALMSLIAIATDVPYADDGSAVYYSTPTHVFGLLLGLALAAICHSYDGRIRTVVRTSGAVDLAFTIAVLSILFGAVAWSTIEPGLYRWQLQAASVASVLLVLGAVYGRIGGRVLQWAPFVEIGRRSYSIYLLHWPAIIVTGQIDYFSHRSLERAVVVLLVVAVLSELSYRLVERLPARRRDGSAGQRFGDQSAAQRLSGRVPAAIAGAIALIFVTFQVPGPVPNGSTHTTRTAHAATTPPSRSGAADRAAARIDDTRISAYGDSVLEGAVPSLRATFPHLTDYAVEGVQAHEIFQEISDDRVAGTLGDVVYLHTGDNGVIDPDELDSTLDSLDDRRVLLATIKVDRLWEESNLEVIREAADSHRHVRIVDWRSAALADPDLLEEDGIHLRPAGARALVDIVVDTLEAW